MIVTHSAAELRAKESARPADLIVLDDNPGDVTLLRAALSEVGPPVTVHVAEDAPRFFSLMREFLDPPALVILDLNLPLLKGTVVLDEIRDDRVWRDVPVVILTSSRATSDLVDCRHRGATDFIVKPSVFDGYIALAQSLARYLSPTTGPLPSAARAGSEPS
jgi:CheY-like chemotaxis protein